jgi:hypothetical protein
VSQRRVLVAGVDDIGFGKLRDALARYPLLVERIPRAASALELVGEVPFHLLVLGYPLADVELGDFLAALRRPGAPSSAAPVVLLAAPPERREAERFRDRGVAAVVGADVEARQLHRAVLSALGVPPRIEVRLLVRLEARLEDGQSTVLCQTENLSRSGMLVRSDRRYPRGTAVGFELALPEGQPVRGQAEVVRQTDPQREPLRGLGLRFRSLDGDGGRRLGAYIDRRL